jgi:hypothetical protein
MRPYMFLVINKTKECEKRLEHPWMLFLLIAPLTWIILNSRSRRGPSLVKALCLCTLILAACNPGLVGRSSRMAITLLADTSASISDQDLKRESDLIRGMLNAGRDHIIRVIPFARSTGRAEKIERTESWKLVHTPGPAGLGTDMERAVHDGIATLLTGFGPRTVILSDGGENLGNLLLGARYAKALAIPIDTIPLVDRRHPGLRLEMAAMPSVAFNAGRFPIDFVVTSPRATPAEIVISSQGKQLD